MGCQYTFQQWLLRRYRFGFPGDVTEGRWHGHL